MEVQVKVTVELGEGTKHFLNGLVVGTLNGVAAVTGKPEGAKAPAKTPAAKEVVKEDKAPEVDEAPKVPTRRRAAAKAEPEAEAPAKEDKAAEAPKTRRRAAAKPAAEADDVKFEDMGADDQLKDLQTRITKHTKKGKTADIKELLSVFDAGRASELETADYVEFSNALERYNQGESVDQIFPALD